MRLNLGSGEFPQRRGFINCDKWGNPDVVCDIRKLPFADNSAEVVVMTHVIEHFVMPDAFRVLKEVYRVLKPGGTFIVESPDVRKAVENYEDDIELSRHLYGIIPDEPTDGDYHKSGWTGRLMYDSLYMFSSRKIEDGTIHRRPKRDFRVVAVK